MAEFLRYFITEPLYIIADKGQEENSPTLLPDYPQIDKKDLVFKGKNAKKVLIIVDQPDEKFISPGTEAFLIKVLKAIHLSADDVAIINFHENGALSKEAVLAFDAHKYLIFGLPAKLFQDTLNLYEIVEAAGNKSILNCSPLEAIIKDEGEKKLLWTALQKMFPASKS